MLRNLQQTAILAVTFLAFTLMPRSAQAQINPLRFAMDVPFAFNAGSTRCAPGHYLAKMRTESILGFQSRNQTAATLVIRNQDGKSDVPHALFHRYGNRYFLREIWLGDYKDSLYLTESAAERRLKRSMLAQRKTEPDGVSIALDTAPHGSSAFGQ